MFDDMDDTESPPWHAASGHSWRKQMIDRHTSKLSGIMKKRKADVMLRCVAIDGTDKADGDATTSELEELTMQCTRRPTDAYMGCARLRGMRALLTLIDQRGYERSANQLQFHEAFIRACGRVLYREDWAVHRTAIMKLNKWDCAHSEVLISTPRRFGKTFSGEKSRPRRILEITPRLSVLPKLPKSKENFPSTSALGDSEVCLVLALYSCHVLCCDRVGLPRGSGLLLAGAAREHVHADAHQGVCDDAGSGRPHFDVELRVDPGAITCGWHRLGALAAIGGRGTCCLPLPLAPNARHHTPHHTHTGVLSSRSMQCVDGNLHFSMACTM